MATTSDKMTVLGSITEIEKTASEVTRDPARIKWGNDGFVTFPDPMEMEAFESDDLLRTILTGESEQALKAWISDEDFAKVRERKLTRRQMTALVKKVIGYYEDVFGPQGEGDASPS